MKRIKKRHYFLLEVLIALAIVAMCGMMLLYPYFFMIKEERSFIQQVKLDRIANRLYVQQIEQLYQLNPPWHELEEGMYREIRDEELATTPYTGTVSLALDAKKNSPPHYLIHITYEFRDAGGNKIEYPFSVYAKHAVAKIDESKPEQDPQNEQKAK